MSVGIMGLGSKVLRCGLLVVSLVLLFSLAGARAQAQTAPCATGTGVCVLSWQQDTGLETSCSGCVYQTGENLEEPTLTASAIQTENFGVLCSAVLDGQVFGQPLVVTNVTINKVTYPRVVYAVTQNDTLYAIDGNPTDNPPCQVLNGNGSGTSLLGSGQYAVDCNHIGAGPTSCRNTIGPYVGILSTPVIHINGDAGTIFLVTEVQNCDPRTGCDPETWGHYLHAVNIQTFADQNVQIYPPGDQSGASTFSQSHVQRPGLLYLTSEQTGLTQGTVYVAFSMMDGAGIPAPNGAIFGYPGDLSPTTVPFYFPISEGINQNDGGGIWGAGGPPAFGPNGSANLLYFTTGNSTAGNTASWHDSFLSLNPNLTMPTTGTPYFTPVDQFFRSDVSCNSPTGNDLDFGSGSAMLLPDNTLAGLPYMAVNGDKEGGMWFINRANPGGHNTQCDLPTPTCSCTPSGNNPSGNVQTLWTGTPYKGNTIHTGMAFWSSAFLGSTKTAYLYVDPQGGPLSRYTLCTSPNASDPICNSTVIKATGYAIPYGATPSISAASPSALSAVVWQAGETGAGEPTGCSSSPTPGCGGSLYAFDANTLKNLYSNHTCLDRDAIAPAVKFSIPTVANGNVYLGTHQVDSNGNPLPGGMFYIFGLNASTCS